MPDRASRFPPARQTLRTRVLMVGVFVGALIALSVNWVFSADVRGTVFGGGIPPEQQERLAAREEAFQSPPGSCVTWTQAGAEDARKVSCEKEHFFEVTGIVDLSDRFPPGAPRPTVDQWRELTEERCVEVAESYLDKPLDPLGKLTVGVLHPDDEQWADGDRKMRCGLQWAAPGGALQPLTAPAAEINQSNVWEVGTCLGLDGKTVGDPVDCAQEHSYEIIGLLDLKKKFPKFPSPDDQHAWLDKQCSAVADKYTGGKNLAKQGLILSWDVREKPSWNAGSTLVNCKVAAKLKDNSGLAPVTGSVAKPKPKPKPTTESTTTAKPPEGDRPAEGGQPADGEQPARSGQPAGPETAGESDQGDDG
ncbi:septum formation family protein [Prauserella shujinwangii]|nr:septum formation family protein [Prauserella shujinwangii]